MVTALRNIAEDASAGRGPADDLHAGNTGQGTLGGVRTVGVLACDLFDVAEVDTRGLHLDQSLAGPADGSGTSAS